MADIELRFVDVQRGRDGRIRYWYFRRNGRRWRLPGTPGSEEFMREYHRLLAATAPAAPVGGREYPPGSVGALIDAFFGDPIWFLRKRPNTQKAYRTVLEPLAKRIGQVPVAQIRRRHVEAMRDERAATPGMANMVVKVVRRLLSYAVNKEYRDDNPALRIELFNLGRHRAWTPEECDAFEAHWPPGSMQRRAFALARFTGQRCGDLATMTRAHRKDGRISVVQEKTGVELWIPERSELTAELAIAQGAVVSMNLLHKNDGTPFTKKYLGQWFAEVIEDAGLPDDCVLHGLRATAASELAEVCTPHEISRSPGTTLTRRKFVGTRKPRTHGGFRPRQS